MTTTMTMTMTAAAAVGIPIWKRAEIAKNSHLGNPRSKIEFVTIWGLTCILLRSIFPALRALCYCDTSKPSMDKIFFLSHRATQAIEQSKEFLDDESLFGSITMDTNLHCEGNMVWGDDDDDDDEDNVVFAEESDEGDEDNDDEDDVDDVDDDSASYTLTLSGKIAWHWNHCKEKLEHEYAVTAWALCHGRF